MAVAIETVPVPVADRPRYLEWGPVIAGAFGAAAISFLLLTFGAAVGLSVTSPWPNQGVSLTVAAWAVVWWTVLVQIGSFAAGGYLAGRMRSRWGDSTSEEGQFRDSAHGFLVWALGVLIGATVLAMTTGGVVKTATQSAGTVAVGAASNPAALAMAPTDYAVDLLLRPSPRVATATPAAAAGTPAAAGTSAPAQQRADDVALRAEASRIFAASIKNQEFSRRDRDYLTQVVTARTGLPETEAQQRVDAAMNEARDLEIRARQAANQARKAAVIAGFIAAASLLVSLVVACLAAGLGGKHRDEGRLPHFFGHRRFW
jgi:hypothetical protein